MALVELKYAASGELCAVDAAAIDLITQDGTGRTTCVVMDDGTQLVVQGGTVEVLKQINRALG